MAGRQQKRLQRALTDDVSERMEIRRAIMADMRAVLARLKTEEEEDAAEITAIMGLPAAAAPAAAAPDVIVDGPVFLRVVSGSIKAVRTVATQASE